tara:strand:- start:1562 stop:1801 length:240 start_codon:yes stop_codon:yes gene_type:complete
MDAAEARQIRVECLNLYDHIGFVTSVAEIDPSLRSMPCVAQVLPECSIKLAKFPEMALADHSIMEPMVTEEEKVLLLSY